MIGLIFGDTDFPKEILKTIKKKKIKYLIIPVMFFSLASFLIFTNFNNYIANNDGAVNSDFGQTFETCGCCVDDARICRGQ